MCHGFCFVIFHRLSLLYKVETREDVPIHHFINLQQGLADSIVASTLRLITLKMSAIIAIK